MTILNQYDSANPDNRTGLNIYTGIYEGVVRENKDALYMGRLAVYIPEVGGNIDDPKSWVTVRYASPFYGITPYRDNAFNPTPLQTVQEAQAAGSISPSQFRQVEGSGTLAGTVDNLVNNGQSQGQGEGAVGSQGQEVITSYGMWAVPPDLGVTVLVMFIGGNLNRGFWFACVPTVAHGMVPAIGAPDGKTPMAEFNPIDPQVPVTKDLTSIQRQPYQPLVDSLTAQGLQEDPIRGPITSSSFREAPSNVFGISSKGGHTFVMDDGSQEGTSKLIRLRTSGGNQITMHDDTGMIYLINAQGTGWIELSPSGQIDVFGAAGINMATNGDVNFHADNNVNIHAGNCVKIVGIKGTKVMGGEELQLHGAKTMIEGVDSLHVHSCKEMMFTSFGDIHMKAFNYFCLKGKCFYWNSCTAKEAEQVPPEFPGDVSGYQTTVARAPSKEPYKEHDSGQGAGGGQTGPAESDPNVFASGGGAGGGSGGAGGGGGPIGVPGGVGQIYPSEMPNTGGYNVQNIGNVTAGITAMKNADFIKNVTVHWTGNNGDTLNGVINTAKQRNMGYNAYYDPKTKTFYTQNNHLNLRTNGQLSSADGSNNTNTYHIAIIGGEGTTLDSKDVANIKSYGKDLGTAVGNNNLSVKTHGERNPGHKHADEGEVLRGPLAEGIKSATPKSSDAPKSTNTKIAQTPATSVGKEAPVNTKIVTPTKTIVAPAKSTVSTTYTPGGRATEPTTDYLREKGAKTPSGIRDYGNANFPAGTRVISQQINKNSTTNYYQTPVGSSLSGTFTQGGGGTFVSQQNVGTYGRVGVQTTTYTIAPGAGSGGGVFTSNNPADLRVTGRENIGTNTTVQPTQATLANISTGSQGAGSLGTSVSGSTAPLDPAASGREGRTESELANPDQNQLGETPAQEASQALDQTAGQAPSSDIPAAPGGGNTGCFATGDNCERPIDETGGGQGFDGDPNAGAAQTNYAANDPEGKAAAEAYLGRSMTDSEYNALVAATSAEAGTNQTEQAWVSGTILNRARQSGLTVNQVLNQKGQFEAVTGPGGNANFVRGPNASRAASINGSMKNILPSVPKNNYYFDAANPAAYKYGSMPTNRAGVSPTRIGASRFYPGARWP